MIATVLSALDYDVPISIKASSLFVKDKANTISMTDLSTVNMIIVVYQK